MTFIPLKWRGNKAKADKGVYIITSDIDGYHLVLNGVHLARAQSVGGLKDYALIHVNKN